MPHSEAGESAKTCVVESEVSGCFEVVAAVTSRGETVESACAFTPSPLVGVSEDFDSCTVLDLNGDLKVKAAHLEEEEVSIDGCFKVGDFGWLAEYVNELVLVIFASILRYTNKCHAHSIYGYNKIDIKGGLTCKNNILFYWLFLSFGLSTVRKNFSRFFLAVVSAEIEVKNCMRSSTSACIG